jgi:hypothetical protein
VTVIRWLVAGLLVLALALRLVFLAATPDFAPTLDAAHYDALACGLVLGEGYVLHGPVGADASSCGRPSDADPNPATAFRPPGWPALLAGVYAVGEDGRWARGRVVQALIGTAAVALIGLLAHLLLGPRAGVLALALAALDTTLVVVGGTLLSEPLFVALCAGALCAAAAARGSPRPARLLVVAGMLAGLAALVRTNGLVLIPALIVLAAPSWRAAVLVTAAALLTIAPWTVRNAVRMDAFVPVAAYFGTGLGGTFNEVARTRTDFPGAWVSPRRVPAFRDIHLSGLGELERQDELRRRALRHAREHPGYVVSAAVRNALRILALTDRDWHRGNADALSLPRWTGTLAAAGFWVLLVAAAAGALTAAGRALPKALWLALALLLASAVWFGGEARYRAPLVPVLISLAAACACRAAPGTAPGPPALPARSGGRARPPR